MASFGDELRMERERRGVSIDALSAETKVGSKYIASLEQGDLHELPGGIFRKGIVRAYLSALHLEEQTWMLRFDESVAEYQQAQGITPDDHGAAWIEFASNIKRNRIAGRKHRDWRWFGVLLLLFTLCLAAWALWRFELRQLIAKGP